MRANLAAPTFAASLSAARKNSESRMHQVSISHPIQSDALNVWDESREIPKDEIQVCLSALQVRLRELESAELDLRQDMNRTLEARLAALKRQAQQQGEEVTQAVSSLQTHFRNHISKLQRNLISSQTLSVSVSSPSLSLSRPLPQAFSEFKRVCFSPLKPLRWHPMDVGIWQRRMEELGKKDVINTQPPKSCSLPVALMLKVVELCPLREFFTWTMVSWSFRDKLKRARILHKRVLNSLSAAPGLGGNMEVFLSLWKNPESKVFLSGSLLLWALEDKKRQQLWEPRDVDIYLFAPSRTRIPRILGSMKVCCDWAVENKYAAEMEIEQQLAKKGQQGPSQPQAVGMHGVFPLIGGKEDRFKAQLIVINQNRFPTVTSFLETFDFAFLRNSWTLTSLTIERPGSLICRKSLHNRMLLKEYLLFQNKSLGQRKSFKQWNEIRDNYAVRADRYRERGFEIVTNQPTKPKIKFQHFLEELNTYPLWSVLQETQETKETQETQQKQTSETETKTTRGKRKHT